MKLNFSSMKKIDRRTFSTVLYSWGQGTNGQLGHSKFVKDNNVLGSQYVQAEPRKLLKSSKFTKVGCAYEYSIGLTYDGQLYGWGQNYIETLQNNEPQPIPLASKIKDISVGGKHAAAIDENGNLFTWGFGGNWMKGGGQLGHNSRNTENHPRLVKYLLSYGAKIKKVSCGTHHTLMLTTDGEVLACGVGEYGRLGIGSSEDALIPTTLSVLVEETIIDVIAGDNHSACLTADGRVMTWGKNDIGQLGHSDTYMDVLYSQEELPRVVDGLPSIKQISLARGRTSAVSNDGQLYIWGSMYHHTPTLIPSESFNDLKVENAYSFGGQGGLATLAITEDCSLWSFGEAKSLMLGRKFNMTDGGKVRDPEKVTLFTPSTGKSVFGGTFKRVLDVYGGFGKHAFAKIEITDEVI